MPKEEETMRTKYADNLKERLLKSGISSRLATRIVNVIYYKNNIINDAELYVFCRKFNYKDDSYCYRGWGKRCNEVVLSVIS